MLFGSCDFDLKCFAIFSKMPRSISTLLVILSFMFFFVAQTSITLFFSSKGWKVKYVRHLLFNHHNFFSESSFGIYIHDLQDIQFQPPGKPWEHRLGEVLQGRPKSKFNILFFLSLNLTLVFILCHFDKFQNQSTGEPREHHLGEVLQERSKSECNITLAYLIVLFFWGVQVLLLEIFRNKKISYFRTPSYNSKISQLETFKLPEFFFSANNFSRIKLFTIISFQKLD